MTQRQLKSLPILGSTAIFCGIIGAIAIHALTSLTHAALGDHAPDLSLAYLLIIGSIGFGISCLVIWAVCKLKGLEKTNPKKKW